MDKVVSITDISKRLRNPADKLSMLHAILSGATAADGMVFRDLRDAMGISLRDIEAISGVSRSFIAEWETGSDGNPGLEQSLHIALRRIAREKVQVDLVALAILERVTA